MAGKISDLTAGSIPFASGDLLELIDVSDTAMAGTGTNKKITYLQLAQSLAGGGMAMRSTPSGSSPGSGEVKLETGPDFIYIDKRDDEGADRSAMLNTLSRGNYVTVYDVSNPNAYAVAEVLSVSLASDVYTLTVTFIAFTGTPHTAASVLIVLSPRDISHDLRDGGAKTASYTADVGDHYRVDMNGAGADFVVTFPGSPVVGDRFAYTLARAHATYNLTVARNGSTIYGSTANEALFTTKEAGHTSFWRYESTSSGQGWVRENEPKTNVQVFTSDGTWYKPPGALYCHVTLIPGGGGGGSGRRAGSGARSGGGGGAGGNPVQVWVTADCFGSTESVSVGAGGTAGAAQTANDNNGNSGGAGGATTIGNLSAVGAQPGVGGTNVSGGGGTGSTLGNTGFAQNVSSGFGFAATGGSSGTSGVPTAVGQGAIPGAGAAGAPLSSGGVEYQGGNGGKPLSGQLSVMPNAAGGAAGGTNGANGADASSYDSYLCGGGGAGGGSANAATAGSGGTGGKYGGGGGGGGGSNNSFNSGAGGAGGAGVCVIVTFCK